MLRFSMQIYKNKMRVAKMLTEKVIFVFIFFGFNRYRRMIHEVKCTCFCFSKTVICYLLSVICYPNRKIVLGNCQLSTVTLGDDDIDLFSCFIPLFHGCLISKS